MPTFEREVLERTVGRKVLDLFDDLLPIMFMCGAKEMADVVMTAKEIAKKGKDEEEITEEEVMKLISAIGDLWKETKSITRKEAGMMAEGMDLLDKKEKDNELSSVPELINCY